MTRIIQISLTWVIVAALATSASAQGFTLNPFTKKEPEPTRRSVSDAPEPEKPAFQLPKLSLPSLPKPQLPKISLPKMSLPKLALPGMSKKPSVRRSASDNASPLTRFNQGARNFFTKTNDIVMAPWRAATRAGTSARQASSSRSTNKKTGGVFRFPWSSADDDPPPKPRDVPSFLAQPRPGFDD